MKRYAIIAGLAVGACVALAETYVVANRQGVDGNRAFVNETMVRTNYYACELWMPFATASSLTNDFSGVCNDATLVNAVYTNTVGGAIAFDGSGDYLSFGDDMPVGTSRTWAAWVKFNAVGKDQAIISKYDASNVNGNWLFWCDAVSFQSTATNVISLIIRTSSALPSAYLWSESTAGAAATGAWIHVAAVHNRGVGAQIYINGAVSSGYSVNTSNTVADETSTDLRIGASADGNRNFDGQIGDVRVFSRALSATEITNMYLRTKGAYQ